MRARVRHENRVCVRAARLGAVKRDMFLCAWLYVELPLGPGLIKARTIVAMQCA